MLFSDWHIHNRVSDKKLEVRVGEGNADPELERMFTGSPMIMSGWNATYQAENMYTVDDQVEDILSNFMIILTNYFPKDNSKDGIDLDKTNARKRWQEIFSTYPMSDASTLFL
jgi:hypothetical protein